MDDRRNEVTKAFFGPKPVIDTSFERAAELARDAREREKSSASFEYGHYTRDRMQRVAIRLSAELRPKEL